MLHGGLHLRAARIAFELTEESRADHRKEYMICSKRLIQSFVEAVGTLRGMIQRMSEINQTTVNGVSRAKKRNARMLPTTTPNEDPRLLDPVCFFSAGFSDSFVID